MGVALIYRLVAKLARYASPPRVAKGVNSLRKLHIMWRTGLRLAEGTTMHNRDPFRPPAREPKPGTFHRPAHAFGIKHVAEAAELRLSGPMSGQQKLGEGGAELPLVGRATRTKEQP